MQLGETANPRMALEKGNNIYRKTNKSVSVTEIKKKPSIEKKLQLEEIIAMFCIASRKDVCILWLPVGPSKLKPIKLIWTQVKYHFIA